MSRAPVSSGDRAIGTVAIRWHGGSLELYSDATWTGVGTESLTIGGSFELDTDAAFTASNGTTTFTTSDLKSHLSV